ncbi:MAG: elongation factor G, partial [Candidatus Omnitrophica bacterium]|nr:elongation factor G [Candidatus Omnitrophota bacterium]
MRPDLTKKHTFLICGHAQSGKTSLTAAILHKCGITTRLGKVDDGTSISDSEDIEKERKSSVSMSFLHAGYKGVFLQFVDVPGYLDFAGELTAAIRAVDFAVIVVDGASGVEVGTERAWDLLKKEDIPCMFFINKLDKENSDFDKTAVDIRETFSKQAIPFMSYLNGDVKSALEDKESELYTNIIETIAESDDALTEEYLETGDIKDQEFVPALDHAVVERKIFPIVGGVATDEKGAELFLNVLSELMPPESDVHPMKAIKDGQEVSLPLSVDAPVVAQVVKTIIDPFVGKITIFRVFSGKIETNKEIYNATQNTKEKIGQVGILQAKKLIPQDAIAAGEIGAVTKMKDAQTGDVFCEKTNEVELPPLVFPLPVYSASVKPKTRKDEDKISEVLARLMQEDKTCKISRDSQTKELIVSGMGELHLQVILEQMMKKYGADVELGTPSVPYKETITKQVKVQYKHKKQSGGHGQYADVWLEIEPLERGGEFKFVNKVVGGAIPRNFIPSVEKGVRKAMEAGYLAGQQVTDVQVTLFDGSYHTVDSSDMAFQIAGAQAFKKAMSEASPTLLEPVMDVEVTAPKDFMGQITGDISIKRGRVQGIEAKGKNEVVKAKIPLGEMFKYASDLKSATGGRGSYVMSFSHYDVVPQRIAQGIIEKAVR